MRQDRAACIATHAFTLLLGLALAGCAGETGATAGSRGVPDAAAAVPGTQAGENGGTAPATSLPPLAPDRMPAQLADFPLPDDVSFIAPPRYEFGRLIVGLNTSSSEDEVATLLDAQLEARGYAISKKLNIGPQRWRFVKDGRNGIADVDQNNTDMPTVITINLFVGDTP